MQSMSLKVKKVTSRLSDCEFISHDSLSSFGPITMKNKVTVNQSNVLVNVNRAHQPSKQINTGFFTSGF